MPINNSKKCELTEKEICRGQAVKSFSNGRYGSALDWALRSQDIIYVTSIADHFLRVRISINPAQCK